MLTPKSGKLIHKTDDIEVRQDNHTRWMTFGGPNIQSAMSLSDPTELMLHYMHPMMGVLLFQPRPKHCLLLGLGGGGIVRYLHHFHPQINITAVEISDTVVNIAKDHFNLPEESDHLRLITTDACKYIENPHHSSGIVLIDIYGKDNIPPPLFEKSFYQHCFNTLSTQGVMAVNLLVQSESEFKTILKLIREVFDHHTLALPIKGHKNVVIFGFKQSGYGQRVEALAEEGSLSGVTFDVELGLLATALKSAFSF